MWSNATKLYLHKRESCTQETIHGFVPQSLLVSFFPFPPFSFSQTRCLLPVVSGGRRRIHTNRHKPLFLSFETPGSTYYHDTESNPPIFFPHTADTSPQQTSKQEFRPFSVLSRSIHPPPPLQSGDVPISRLLNLFTIFTFCFSVLDGRMRVEFLMMVLRLRLA